MIKWECYDDGTRRGRVNGVWTYLVWNKRGTEQYCADVFDNTTRNWFDWDIPFGTIEDAKQWCETHYLTGAGDD